MFTSFNLGQSNMRFYTGKGGLNTFVSSGVVASQNLDPKHLQEHASTENPIWSQAAWLNVSECVLTSMVAKVGMGTIRSNNTLIQSLIEHNQGFRKFEIPCGSKIKPRREDALDARCTIANKGWGRGLYDTQICDLANTAQICTIYIVRASRKVVVSGKYDWDAFGNIQFHAV